MEICYNTKPFWKEDPELVFRAFNDLGMLNLELHLSHFLLHGWKVDEVKSLVDKYNLGIPIVDGGWFDFLEDGCSNHGKAPLEKQIELAKIFNADLRLFLTRASTKQIWKKHPEELSASIDWLIDMSNGVRILFETHEGVTLKADWMFNFFEQAQIYRRAINEKRELGKLVLDGGLVSPGIVYDPMNMIRGLEDPIRGYDILRPLIHHIHLKGGQSGKGFGSIGEGKHLTDMIKFLKKLKEDNYMGFLGIEYEGIKNPFLGLLKSKQYLLWANRQFELGIEI